MPSQSQVSQALNEIVEDDIKEEVQTSTQTFDFNKYTISNDLETKVLEIDDTSFEVKIKPLSWSNRNRILSNSIQLDGQGNTAFDGDLYIRNCLREMLVEAPWGRTTESFLLSIDYKLGSVLEELVPKAFGDDVFGGGTDVETLKADT